MCIRDRRGAQGKLAVVSSVGIAQEKPIAASVRWLRLRGSGPPGTVLMCRSFIFFLDVMSSLRGIKLSLQSAMLNSFLEVPITLNPLFVDV